MEKEIELNKLELKKKDRKKQQIDHDKELWYAMVALGFLSEKLIVEITSPILSKEAKYVINNSEDFTDVDDVRDKDETRLKKSFYKLGMLHNPQQEQRVIQLAVINANKYIKKIKKIDGLDESENYKKELKSIVKAKSIAMLRNDYTRMMSSLSLMEFYRVYEGQEGLWKLSISKKYKRKEHLAIVGHQFTIGIGVNIPYSKNELAVILPYKGLHPKQLINCKCDVILLSKIDNLTKEERLYYNLFI